RATSSPFPSFIDPAPTDLYTLSLHDALPILFEYATLHLHDTFGRAAECVREALQLGIRSFDGAVSGIGGCPYASKDGKRAPGNIATELLVRTIEEAGYTTRLDAGRLAEAGRGAGGVGKRWAAVGGVGVG